MFTSNYRCTLIGWWIACTQDDRNLIYQHNVVVDTKAMRWVKNSSNLRCFFFAWKFKPVQSTEDFKWTAFLKVLFFTIPDRWKCFENEIQEEATQWASCKHEVHQCAIARFLRPLPLTEGPARTTWRTRKKRKHRSSRSSRTSGKFAQSNIFAVTLLRIQNWKSLSNSLCLH